MPDRTDERLASKEGPVDAPPVTSKYIGETEKNLLAQPEVTALPKPWWKRLLRL